MSKAQADLKNQFIDDSYTSMNECTCVCTLMYEHEHPERADIGNQLNLLPRPCPRLVEHLSCPLIPIVHLWLHHAVHCSKKDSLCTLTHEFCISRKGGRVGGGWGHPQGAVHMVATRLDCERAIVTHILLA